MAIITVEKIEPNDGKAICDLARIAHEESLFAGINFSEEKIYRMVDNSLEQSQKYLGLKVSSGEEIVGFCYAFSGPYYAGDGAKVVTVIALFTAPHIRRHFLGGKAALRLVRGIELWARSIDAAYILYYATSGTDPENSDRFFRKAGAQTLGGNYAISLNSA